MALIGTISGSVGSGGVLTSATAISGTLIIADAAPGSFPTLPSGVKLYVSGTRGADVDSASALFGGDVFMSGALGLQEYLQLRPIDNKRFPTATTASYIYASGSTNDLYFTQFSGSLRNDVRLRWLEGSLTTGLLNGGVVSTENGTTTFSVTAGAGIVIAQNAAITSEPYPTVTYVKWPAFVSASLDYSGSAQITYVAVDSAGALTQLNTPPTLAQYRDRIVLGRVLHQTGSVSNGAINSPAMAYAVSSNTFDFIRPFGPLKVSGHVLAASGSTLGLTKTAGDSYAEGRNYAFDPSSPNAIFAAEDPDLINCKIFYQHVSGSTTITNTGTGNAGFTVIDRAQYNNGGDLDTVGNSEWTNQRVYWFPRSVNRALFVYYGSAKYDTLLEAVAGLQTENFVEGDNTKGAAIYVGSVSVKGNELNLADTTNVRITQGGLFRASGGGGGGGGGSTPPGGLDTYVQFNDGSAFGGDAGLTYNKLTASLTVTGNITGSRFTSNTAGSLVNGGGQIYLNGATTNRIDFSSQGTGNPEFNAPTAGTKVVLYPAAGASATDYAIGISPAVLWQSIPSTDTAMMFKWFGGTTTLAALSGSGNMEISGDLAVNGGDITSTAAALNISAGASGFAFQLTNASFATFVSGANGPIQQATLQASSGKSLVIAAGLGSTAPTPQVTISGSYVEIRSGRSGSPSGTDFSTDVGGLAQSYLNVNSGSYVTSLATVTNVAKIAPGDLPVPHDVLLGASATRNLYLSGSSVVANMGNSGFSFQRDGSSYGVIQGVSGSSFTIGSAAGVISMNLVSSGNVTVKLDSDNDALGHKFVIQDWNNIEQFSVGENGNAELSGSLVVSGSTNIGVVVENLINSNGSTGVVAFDTSKQGIFYVNGPTGGITANFTNVPTTNLRVLTPTVILSQSATPQSITAVQIDGDVQTLKWANGTTPTATANRQDVFGFSLIRSGSIWTVLGQLSTYG